MKRAFPLSLAAAALLAALAGCGQTPPASPAGEAGFFAPSPAAAISLLPNRRGWCILVE